MARTLRYVAMGKRLFCVGFLWRHSLSGSPDHDCWIAAGRQVGFGLAGGPPRGQSLALCVRRSPFLAVPSALLLLVLNDNTGRPFWWLYAQDADGLVAGFADSLYATEKEGNDAFLSAKALLERKSGPPDVLFRSAAPGESMRCLGRLTARTPLARLRDRVSGAAVPTAGPWPGPGKRRLARIVRTGLVLVLLSGAAAFCHSLFIDTPSDGAGADFAMEEKERQQMRKRYLEHPELLFPVAGATDTEALFSRLRSVPLTVRGWTLESIVFADPVLTVRYTRTPESRFSGLPEGCVPKANGRFLERTERLSLPGKSVSVQNLLPCGELSGRVLDLGARFRCRTSVVFAAAERRQAGTCGTFVAPWRVGSLHCRQVAQRNIGGLAWELRTLPGFRLSRLTFSRGKWDIEAYLYGM